MGKDNLAMEMLSELKRSSRRKDIIIIILVLALLLSNMIWIGCESQFEEVADVKEQVIEDVDNNENTTFNQEIN